MELRVKITIPDEVLNTENGEAARLVLEQLALEGYKSGQLTTAQIRRFLGFSTRMQVDAFLKEHGLFLEYTIEDLEREQVELDRLLPK
jgi:hypothetical protein